MDLCDLCVVANVAQHHVFICHVFRGLLAVAAYVCILRPLAAARRTPPAATLLPFLLLRLLLLLLLLPMLLPCRCPAAPPLLNVKIGDAHAAVSLPRCPLLY